MRFGSIILHGVTSLSTAEQIGAQFILYLTVAGNSVFVLA